MKKRILSLLLAGTMVLGMMTGCGDTETESNNNVVSSEKESNAAESTESVAEKKEVVELKLLQYGTMSERMEDFFENEFHDRVLDELQIDLTVEFLPWGSQNDISVMLAGGDSFAFMNIPTASKSVFIDNGYILDIDPERVAEIAPNYINARYGFGFDCVKIEGKYWALPVGSKVMAGDGSNITIRNDVLESVGISYDQITNYDELMDAYAAVHEAYPDMWIAPTVQAAARMYPEQVFGEGHYYNISGLDFAAVDQMTGEAIAVYTADFFEKLCKLNEEYFDLGYSSKEYLTDGSFQLAQWNAGNSLTYLGYAEKVVNHELAGVEGSDQRYVKISSLPTYKDKDYDWGISFAKGEEENLDRWFEFFD